MLVRLGLSVIPARVGATHGQALCGGVARLTALRARGQHRRGAFQFARRDRVLDRDVFRFGTATSVLFLVVRLLALGQGQPVQRGPPRVDHIVVVVRVVREASPALGT